MTLPGDAAQKVDEGRRPVGSRRGRMLMRQTTRARPPPAARTARQAAAMEQVSAPEAGAERQDARQQRRREERHGKKVGGSGSSRTAAAQGRRWRTAGHDHATRAPTIDASGRMASSRSPRRRRARHDCEGVLEERECHAARGAGSRGHPDPAGCGAVTRLPRDHTSARTSPAAPCVPSRRRRQDDRPMPMAGVSKPSANTGPGGTRASATPG